MDFLYPRLDFSASSCYKFIMKKFVILLLIATALPSYAIEEITLDAMPKETYKLPQQQKTIKGSLLVTDQRVLDELISLQKEKDIADIETLWKGTVENNKVIEFALKKLATPESQRRIHSSLMAKTLSAVVSGASFLPTLAGSNAAIQTSAFSAGRLAQQLINKKNVPQEVPLTDTEMIELAGLIENLQDTLISTYYNYKNSLNAIKDTRSRMLLYSRNYEKALETDDILDIAISSSLYDNLKIQEYKEEQLARKYHSTLQRLAGKTAVDKLSIYQYDFNATLVKGNIK